MYALSDTEEFLCKEIVDCAFKVHKQLGPGLLEKIYEACFC
jgi:GxxExxY protein